MDGTCDAHSSIGLLPCRPKGVSVFSVVKDTPCVCVNVPHSATRRGRRGYFARRAAPQRRTAPLKPKT